MLVKVVLSIKKSAHTDFYNSKSVQADFYCRLRPYLFETILAVSAEQDVVSAAEAGAAGHRR